MSIILLLHLFMLTFTFGHVELLTVDYHSIDAPIVELNNHTLREVFDSSILDNYHFNDGLDGWTSLNASVISNRVYLNSPIATNAYILQSVLNIGDSYMYYFEYEQINGSFRLDDGSMVLITFSTTNNYRGYFTATGNNFVLLRNSSAVINQGYFDNIKLINRTELGISSLTVEEMDTYFQMYQDNISANDVTYIQNEMTITDLTYILGFSFVWFIIIWSIRKVVL